MKESQKARLDALKREAETLGIDGLFASTSGSGVGPSEAALGAWKEGLIPVPTVEALTTALETRMKRWRTLTVVSGGQTGVDRAALDAAKECELPHGGWCPKGRRAEDGTIPESYGLSETDSSSYRRRTDLNVRDSDGTLIVTSGQLTGGTELTARLAQTKYSKPLLVVNLNDEGAPSPADVITWLQDQGIKTLNVAGPRESTSTGIHQRAKTFLLDVFRMLLAQPQSS